MTMSLLCYRLWRAECVHHSFIVLSKQIRGSISFTWTKFSYRKNCRLVLLLYVQLVVFSFFHLEPMCIY